jgi:hypothetical protein
MRPGKRLTQHLRERENSRSKEQSPANLHPLPRTRGSVPNGECVPFDNIPHTMSWECHPFPFPRSSCRGLGSGLRLDIVACRRVNQRS